MVAIELTENHQYPRPTNIQDPRLSLCWPQEFSNFYWHDVPYTFVMPEYALQSWTPKEIQCQFSEKAP
jgi:hypothetical protein